MLKNFIKDKIKADTVCSKTLQWVCGICNEEGLCYTDARSANFTNHEYVSSLNVCEDCLPLLNSDFRKRNFYITENEARTIAQSEFYSILHNIQLPCILSFTDSNKKHRLFRSKISYKKNEVWITLDGNHLQLNLDTDLKLLDILQDFYQQHKVSKEWILTWDFPVWAIKKIWLEKRKEFEDNVRPYRKTDKLIYLVKFINKPYDT
jgi:hypothetical protein